VLTDRQRPRGAPWVPSNAGDLSTRVRSIALFQNASQTAAEEGANLVLAGLAAAGFADGPSCGIHRYNA
jgi:hypothetical protein